MFIYKIENRINQKVYVGQTLTNIKKRFNSHKYLLRKGKHRNQHLQNAWNKYGERNFIFELIENIKDDRLLTIREQYWCDFYESNNRKKGYNIRICVDSNSGLSSWNKDKKCECLSGENNGRAKLNQLEIEEIREKYQTGKYTYQKLSLEYNISSSVISGIILNKNWENKEYNFAPFKESPNAKLSSNEVSEIREKHQTGKYTYQTLAKIYDVEKSNIGYIIRNLSWTNEKYEYCESILNPSAKITWDDAEEIRKKYIPRKYSANSLAKEYNISKSSVYRIINNELWKIEKKGVKINKMGAVLSFEKAEEIRKKNNDKKLTQKQLCEIYNVGKTAIFNILNYKTYKPEDYEDHK